MNHDRLFIDVIERASLAGGICLLAVGCASEAGVGGAAAALERRPESVSAAPRPGRVDRSTYAGRAIYRDGYIQLLSARGVEAPERVRAAFESRVYDPVLGGADEGMVAAEESIFEVEDAADEMSSEASSGDVHLQIVNPAVLSGRTVLESERIDVCSVESR